jgi:hypothetical protein
MEDCMKAIKLVAAALLLGAPSISAHAMQQADSAKKTAHATKAHARSAKADTRHAGKKGAWKAGTKHDSTMRHDSTMKRDSAMRHGATRKP